MIVRELFAKLGLDVDEAGFIIAERAISSLQKGFVKFGAATLGALGVTAAAFAKTTADAGDAAGKLAQRTGVDSIALQEFGYSAGLADVSMEELARAMQFLAKSGVKDVQGEILKLADQFKGMPDDGAKVQLAMERLGKAGANMIPWLNSGSEELARLAEEAHAVGVVFSEEAQKDSEEFNDELTRLVKTLTGLRNVIGLKLLKPLRLASEVFRGWVMRIQLANVSLVKTHTVLKTLAAFLVGTFFASLALSSSGFAALGVTAVSAAVKAAMAWVAAALPVAALGAALGLVILIIEDIYMFFSGKGRTVLGDFVKHVKQEFGGWRGFFTSLLNWVTGTFNEFWTGLIVQALEAAYKIGQGFGATIRGAIAGLPGGVFMLNAGAAVSDVFTGGGASPSASVASSPSKPPTVNAPQFRADITVNAAPGMSAQEVSNHVIMASDDWWNSKMRETAAGVE